MAGRDVRLLRATKCRRCLRVFTQPGQYDFVPVTMDEGAEEYGLYELVCRRGSCPRPHTASVDRMREARDALSAAIEQIEDDRSRYMHPAFG